MLTLVTGGARSGKSGFAERLTMHEHESAVYIATGQAYDSEMQERILRHRREREASGYAWSTLEEPHAVQALLRRLGEGQSAAMAADTKANPDAEAETTAKANANAGERSGTDTSSSGVLVDCLTLWLSNRLLYLEHELNRDDRLLGEIEELVEAAEAFPGRLTVVTNEVGSGIVPEYKLGRVYRDWAGRLNRAMAERAERVFLVTAGIPIELKSIQYRIPGEGHS